MLAWSCQTSGSPCAREGLASSRDVFKCELPKARPAGATESALILTFHSGKEKDGGGGGTARSLISMEVQGKEAACSTKEHGERLFPVFC